MNNNSTRDLILHNDDHILGELKNFLIYYNLKHTLRWGKDNSSKDETESVAEHIYGMHILIDYFLPFYPDLSSTTVRQLATWHDMAEAIVDDMTTRTKTKDHEQAELAAEKNIAETASPHLQANLSELFRQFNEQSTAEARFVKAIDKVEPIFHLYFLAETTNINKEIFKTKDSGWTMPEYREHRRPYIEPFEIIWRFDTIMTPVIDQAGFFRELA